ncbi:MAG: isoprenylcysteine carboxylmethyltransferase family protein [Thermoanaerobaculia bacterium]
MESLRQLFRSAPSLFGFEIKRLNRLRLAGSFVMVPLLLLQLLFSAQSTSPDSPRGMLGILVLTAGVGLRFWALGNIDGKKKSSLVTWGAYNRIRHPLYLGSFLILVAFCILAGSWTTAVLAGIGFLVLYLPVIRAEERLLAHQYGAAWQLYLRNSWAFLPRIGARGAAHEAGYEAMKMPFHLRRPARDIGVLVLVYLGVIWIAELLRLLRSSLDLPHWFI